MATLECPAPLQSELDLAPAIPFDPSAVPHGPTALAHLAAVRESAPQTQDDQEDLIQLGQEQLFAGTRTRGPLRREGEGDEQREPGGETDGTAAEQRAEGSQELLGSLGAAKHAFLFALNSLVHEYLGSTSRPASASFETQSPSSVSSPPPPNPFADPSSPPPSFQPASHREVDAADRATPNPPTTLLSTLLDSLRSQDSTPLQQSSSAPSPVMRSIERISPLARSPRSPQLSASADGALLEELQARIDALAVDVLPPTEAELARTLASLLSCIERLATISRTEDAPPAVHAAAPTPPAELPSANVYETLEREAAALLQSSREQPSLSPAAVVGAVREVEQAERDLLWGRVDDLSERVKLLSRQRAEGLAQEQAPQRSAGAAESLYEAELGDLPQYSRDSEAGGQAHLPPAYYGDGTVVSDEKDAAAWDIKPPRSPSLLDPASAAAASSTRPAAARARKISSAHSEKMQRDLDSVSEAIERLYVVSPQLANQRVEPDRRRQRERQLAKLGNAIERLSQGRLEDQRAVPSPTVDDEDEGEMDGARRAAQRREKEQRAFDRLLDQIDRAASRTLADQRVELNGKRKEVLNLDTVNPQFEPFTDKYEARRREYILEHSGKGRLDSQDAKLRSSGLVAPFPRPPAELDQSVTITEFFAGEQTGEGTTAEDAEDRARQRSQSLPAVRKKFSSRALFQPKTAVGEDATSLAAGKNGSLRSGLFKKAPSLAGSRRGSYDASGMTGLGVFGAGASMSRSASVTGLEVLEVSQFDWVTEESRNLGTLVVTFWPRSSPSTSKRAADELDVVAVEPEAILVAPTRGGPASRLSLPCKVVPQKATIASAGAYHEVKLVTAGLTSPTKSRADLEVHTPLSTDELRATMPSSFRCATCDAELVDAAPIARYNALPSEHWAELLDAWMCHQDQTLSDDLIAKGKGIKPRGDEGLVGTSYILLPQEMTRNWITPEGVEPSKANNGDFLYPAHCASCSTLVGSHVRPVGSSSDEPTAFRLLKYASYPASTQADLPRYSLASYLTAELLETGQAHACHRFVLEDAVDEQARLLLWFFNPAIRIAFSTSANGTSALQLPSSASTPSSASASPASSNGSPSSSSSSTPTKPAARSMNAVKVFYTSVQGDNDPACIPFTTNKSERVAYPRAVLERVAELLQASTLVYPSAKRRFGDLAVGFLERI
ncbi:hypothetical protein JCM10450v2_003909 [Rhodotorula kratochvilovae]